MSDKILVKCSSTPGDAETPTIAFIIAGTALESPYIETFKDAGFEDIKVLRRFDYFSGSSSENTRKAAAGFGALRVELTMAKPSGQPGLTSRPRNLLRLRRRLRIFSVSF